jgi:hypothetical protein
LGADTADYGVNNKAGAPFALRKQRDRENQVSVIAQSWGFPSEHKDKRCNNE